MQTNTFPVVEEAIALEDCLERLQDEKTTTRPLSTYRLQFNENFRFTDACRLVPYLHRLGVSHCYASPILKARAGSPHGYDIIDHNQINPEIGTEEEFRQLVSELKAHGLGLLLDTVPNHMGIGPGPNPWWQDVLQNGRASAHADFFDIDWQPLKHELRDKVLIPILGNSYGEELEQGNIQLRFEQGQCRVRYFENVLPVDPQTVPLIFDQRDLTRVGDEHDRILGDFRALLAELRQMPTSNTTEPSLVQRRQRELPVLLRRLERLGADPYIAGVIDHALQAMNGRPGEPKSFDGLHCVLEAQPYRLAFWRVSGEEINYRRFFDVNDLVGLRMEDPRVFAETHKLIRRLLGQGLVQGLRIDHPDGLLNPVQYFRRLQMLYVASRCCGPEPKGPTLDNGIEFEVKQSFQGAPQQVAPMYLLVEKILERGEHLPAWPVDGTVGYSFLNLVNGVLVDRRSEHYLTNLYHRVIGRAVDPNEIIYESKKHIMYSALASEVNVLSHLLDQISMPDRRARDFTRSVLRNVIRETIAEFPVYRTYIDERGNVSEFDRRYIEDAIERGKLRTPEITPAFDFLRRVLLLQQAERQDDTIFGYSRQLYFTLKFQQLTGPVMAKGLEDTTCYVYNRFTSLNEVGGSPAEFGVSLSEFHQGNRHRAERWRHSMLATSTHDTKRSEDVRARLDVLSEMPRHWSANVMKWRRMNRARKIQLSDGRLVPDANEEYLLYQTIVGTWPMQLDAESELQEFVERIQRYMEKAVHEAKVNLSWLNSNPDYVSALKEFIARILAPEVRGKSNHFFESLLKFLPQLKFFGAMNSLTQTLLKLTCPGVPDVYQGQELWDFSLVDPDNRRAVKFATRTEMLNAMQAGDNVGRPGMWQELLDHWQDGRIKLWLTERVLNFRREHRALFGDGDYLPLRAQGNKEENVIAFARNYSGESVVVVAPRFAYSLMRGGMRAPVGTAWGDSKLALPPGQANRTFRNVFTGQDVRASGDRMLCRELFAHLPFALLAT
jgi:(1->4)-alpha-D-glucan 1-alpha-D-glucosylmutase